MKIYNEEARETIAKNVDKMIVYTGFILNELKTLRTTLDEGMGMEPKEIRLTLIKINNLSQYIQEYRSNANFPLHELFITEREIEGYKNGYST